MNALKERLLTLIRAQGPITMAQYMQAALADPEHGYYMCGDPLGRDFITAPEVSQMFGELLGLFFVEAWESRGRPASFQFVELGPGRGTLMADMMRAAVKVRPEFVAAAEIVLVEISPALRAVQEKALSHLQVRWARALDEDGEALFLVANEFFDALPIRQFVKGKDGWHERLIGDDGRGELCFTLTPDPSPDSIIPTALRRAEERAVLELNPGAASIMRSIASRLGRSGGLTLTIDYGHTAHGTGDTLQAVRAHGRADVLAAPGKVDLTAHVDFAALKEAAEAEGVVVYGPVGQGQFLEALGITSRADRLKLAAPERASDIAADLRRLTAPDAMGTLFKAMAISARGEPPPAGFPC